MSQVYVKTITLLVTITCSVTWQQSADMTAALAQCRLSNRELGPWFLNV